MVPQTIVREPSQSIALSPARRGVLGVSMSRKTRMIMNARPSKGTVGGLSVWMDDVGIQNLQLI